jgi:hypothetical protein
MKIEPGAKFWIPCQVRRGEFPDERIVHVGSEAAAWDGFVHVRALRDPIDEGETAVAVTIVEATDRSVSARLPGQVKPRHYFSAPPSVFRELASS